MRKKSNGGFDTHSVENEDEIDVKSKTRIKQEMLGLQAVGKDLIALPDRVYRSIPTTDELNEAIATHKRINSNNAKKRQMQYIGKIMRNIDSEPIIKALNDYKNGRKRLAREFQGLEAVRLKLIEGHQETLANLIEQHPSCDRQQLMQLIRSAKKEHDAEKPDKNFKKLFQLLKNLSEKNVESPHEHHDAEKN